MKKSLLVALCVLLFAFFPLMAQEQKKSAAAEKTSYEELLTKTYTLRYVSPSFVADALHIYFSNHSFVEGSNLLSVTLRNKNVSAFEEQLRKLDVPKKNILLRVFTIIAGKEGKNEAIENKELKHVLVEVSNLLSFKSYLLDGASVITLKDGTRYGNLLLSSAMLENLQLDFSQVSLLTGTDGKRSVKLGLRLTQFNGKVSLLNSETEIAENGYLVAGVSRIGNEGKALVLVINTEIK